MRRRAPFGIASLGGLVAVHAALGQPAAPPADSERRSAALPSIKLAILKATGYTDAVVTVTLRTNQFWVTIVNSPLNQATARQREAQAAQIAGAIADKVRQVPPSRPCSAFTSIMSREVPTAVTPVSSTPSISAKATGTFGHHTTW